MSRTVGETILVTGGAGFIASHIVDAYLAAGHTVVVVDNLVSGRRANVNPRATLRELDVCSPELRELFAECSPSIVSHHAAQTEVGRSVLEPQEDARVNILGTLNVLEACVRSGVGKVIFASSGGTVYGNPRTLPVGEEHPLLPISPYGIAKMAGEHYVSHFAEACGLGRVVFRYGNVYGPRQRPDGESGVIAIFADKMLRGEVPTIYGTGEKVRDYVYIEDVVDINVRVLQQGAQGIWNVGTGAGTTVNEVYRGLQAATGFGGQPIHAEERRAEVKEVVLDIGKARGELGWQARTSLADGLARYVQHLRSGA
jgi:UDP-glucose 4-epimerase